jgi:DoxX-like family
MATKTENNKALWTVQVLLALVFLFAGGSKLVLPLEAMQGPVALPGLFIRFIGVAEVTGALGLVLPGMFRVRAYLTPIAAIGLVLIMSGATAITVEGGMVGASIIPAIVGSLAAIVVLGRRVWLETEAAAPLVLVRRLRAA